MALVCSYGKQFSVTPFIDIVAFVGVNLFWVTCVCLFKSWGNKFDRNNVLKGSPFFIYKLFISTGATVLPLSVSSTEQQATVHILITN
jgi:hypothetical protein